MTRRKGERTRAQIDRDFPYQVEVAIPFGGLRGRLDELNAIARTFDHALSSDGTTDPDKEAARWCFRTPDDAAEFLRVAGSLPPLAAFEPDV